ncbi:MAG: ParB/RepB/Spo0J family partition protein [Bdellovibrionales bacterium]|nr:ParB/RepB/Spo0J family partition protein [Massilia sp.]
MTVKADDASAIAPAPAPSPAQRKQFKFSGLVSSGVIAPMVDHGTEPQFSNSLTSVPVAVPAALNVAAHGAVQWELIKDEQVYEVDVKLLDDSPYQPEEQSRDRYNSEAIDELAHTMANAGQQEPVTVRMVKGRFELIAGHRRIRAATSLGWEKIRALVVVKDDRDAEKSVMVHNEGRKDLSDYSKAKLYQRAKQKGYAKKQDDIANMFATKQGSVSKRLAMLALPRQILDMLEEKSDLFGMNTAAVIHDLLEELPDEGELITKAVARIKHEGANESSIRGWIGQMLQARNKIAGKPGRGKPKVITDPAGRQLYTAKLEGRVITLRVSALDLDPVATLEAMVEFFQISAKSGPGT